MVKSGCVFCKIIKKEIPAGIIFEDDNMLVLEDTKPQAPVHVLVIPKRHIEKVSDLTGDDIRLMGELVFRAKVIADQKGVGASGYRIVLNCNRDAGQEVFHLHLHLLGGRKFTWPPG